MPTPLTLLGKPDCHLCHEISDTGESGASAAIEKLSRYRVLKPNVPEIWMPASIFDHGAHQEVACDSCHLGVHESTKTADVLLPGVNNCHQCHAGPGVKGAVASECVLCHSFHDPIVLEENRKREIEKILLSFRQKKPPPAR